MKIEVTRSKMRPGIASFAVDGKPVNAIKAFYAAGFNGNVREFQAEVLKFSNYDYTSTVAEVEDYYNTNTEYPF